MEMEAYCGNGALSCGGYGKRGLIGVTIYR